MAGDYLKLTYPGGRYPLKGPWTSNLGKNLGLEYPLWTEYYGMLENIMEWGTPGCEQTENITLPILRMRAENILVMHMAKLEIIAIVVLHQTSESNVVQLTSQAGSLLCDVISLA